MDALRHRFRALKCSAPFWSLRYFEETREVLAVRQDTLEPPQLSTDRGAMLTVVTEGGYGYCATSDLSTAGLQAALDRAAGWADATRDMSVHPYDPARMSAPRGEQRIHRPDAPAISRSELCDLLADECRRAKIDDRIVERYAALELREVEQLFLTNTGGDIVQQFRYTVPQAHVTANAGVETQTRSFSREQQGGLEQIERSGFVGSGAHLAHEALQLLAAPNCPSDRMDVLL
ncbi:MAG TPA: DNA gyrase modulator, partial [Burkholderiales bacterium]|nr:DNA gyrase modulator [Burkholderiales bacterium]